MTFWRLRVGRKRVIYDVKAIKGERQTFCFYASYRATVYAVLRFSRL